MTKRGPIKGYVSYRDLSGELENGDYVVFWGWQIYFTAEVNGRRMDWAYFQKGKFCDGAERNHLSRKLIAQHLPAARQAFARAA